VTGFDGTDRLHMARALELAARGIASAHPNPRVGCVLVREGKVIGEGWHERAGGPHAEAAALTDAVGTVAGATAYVTLEPCNHHGRTPPCSEALIDAGVTRVVYAVGDPNPLVNGRGDRRLREAGVQVQSGLMEAEATALNAGFIKRMQRGAAVEAHRQFEPHRAARWPQSVDHR
jgi:diaminohydroxyphosphoribosylaminopyrimidine deaminase/5-amino-6-(5-phosphoribosylamino)uracil reductase